MNKVFVALVLCCACVFAAPTSCTIGKLNVHPTTPVDFAVLAANPEKYDNQWISFTAVVRAISGKQSFNKVEVGTDNTTVTVTVQAESDMFTYPLDASGAQITAEGQFHVLAASVQDYSLVATGVSLKKTTGTVCGKFPQEPRINDMDKNTEFEGDFMGSGLVTLNPGEQMHLHSTNHSTEIVTVLDGTITFVLYPCNEVPLKYTLPAHSAIMVPHSTMHMVANTGSVKATYLYVHAITPVMPAGTL